MWKKQILAFQKKMNVTEKLKTTIKQKYMA